MYERLSLRALEGLSLSGAMVSGGRSFCSEGTAWKSGSTPGIATFRCVRMRTIQSFEKKKKKKTFRGDTGITVGEALPSFPR